MPRKAPAEPIDHHYNIPRLNRAFAATAIVLTVVFMGMVVEDYSRGWKRIQRTFMRLDARKTREAALAARRKALGEERAKLRAELALANKELAAHRRELARLDRKLKELAPQVYLADQEYKFTKASFDAERYKYEDALATAPKRRRRTRGGWTSSRRSSRRDGSAWPSSKGGADARRPENGSSPGAKNRDLHRETDRRLPASLKRLAGLREDAVFKLRNSPILDMVNPSLRVQQVQLPDHFNNVNFMRIPRVDRCTTCHIGADRKGFEDAKPNAVFRSHPRHGPDGRQRVAAPLQPLRVHPLSRRARPGDLVLVRRPLARDPREEARWTRELDWNFDRFNDTPILPLKYTEAGCYRCHAGETNFREAPTLDAGIKSSSSSAAGAAIASRGWTVRAFRRSGRRWRKSPPRCPRTGPRDG